MTVAPYIAILLLMTVLLAAQVIILRNKLRISMGDGGNDLLALRVRIFGNFSEYAPLLIAALIACEISDVSSTKLHIIGFLAVIGRVSHAIAFQPFMSDQNWHLRLRSMGMIGTLAAFILAAFFLLFS